VRLLEAFEDLAADAQGGFLGFDRIHLETPLRVVIAVLVAQLVPALGDEPDAAPLAVAHLENVLDPFL